MATEQVATSRNRMSILACGLSVAAVATLAPSIARAEEPAPMAAPVASSVSLHPGIGGHIGIATKLVNLDSDNTTNIGDQFSLAFPIGIGFQLTDKLAIDFETIPSISVHPRGFNGFTVDPGVVYNLGSVVIGLRVKWDIGGPSNIGVIPLVHKAIADLGHGVNWFVEGAFPTTLAFTTQDNGLGNTQDHTNFSVGVVFHTGLGF
jgi:hypothetical protein